jgi:D-aminopeptidase
MPRARALGIPFDGVPGPLNAITDVKGVEVGHETIIFGEGKLVPGQGPVRTGVTAVLPRGKRYSPVFGGWNSFNGCGELTGTAWLEESGFLESAILLTNTISVGTVRDATIQWAFQHVRVPFDQIRDVFWGLPMIGEIADMVLNDMFGFHVQAEHVFAALDNAASGLVAEGNVGGGTGAVCHDFKGGIGTASRWVEIGGQAYTVGVLVQANHGARSSLTIAGVPVGKELTDQMPEIGAGIGEPGSGSIVTVVATDAPLLPHQLKRLARRVPLGLGRNGAAGNNPSGDLCVAFSTAKLTEPKENRLMRAEFLLNAAMTDLFFATIQATEEAIVNALVAAETMVGINGNTVYAISHEGLQEALKKYNRLAIS